MLPNLIPEQYRDITTVDLFATASLYLPGYQREIYCAALHCILDVLALLVYDQVNDSLLKIS